MANAAASVLNLDLTASSVVGDRPEDIGLAQAVGASAVYLGTDDRQWPGVGVTDPGRRGPIHLGACHRMSSAYDRQAPASDADSPVKFPLAPYASAASYFDAYAEEMAGSRSPSIRHARARGGDPGRGLPAGCEHLLLRQRRVGVDRQPHAVRPRERRPDGHRPQPPCAQPQRKCGTPHRGSERLPATRTSSFISFNPSRSRATCSSRFPRQAVRPTSSRALTWARDQGLRTIALTGFDGGAARSMHAEVSVHVDCTNYGVVEDFHQTSYTALAQYIRHSRMSPDTISTTRVLNHDPP